MTWPRLALAAAACLTFGCATSKAAQGDLARLEQERTQLRAELGEKSAAAQQAFDAASQAESRAGVAGASCSQVSLTKGGAPSRSGTQHAKVQLNGPFVLRPKFAGARNSGPIQVAPGSCQVAR